MLRRESNSMKDPFYKWFKRKEEGQAMVEFALVFPILLLLLLGILEFGHIFFPIW